MFPNNHLPLLQLEHDPGEEVLLVVQDDHINITVSEKIDCFQKCCSLYDLSGAFLGLISETQQRLFGCTYHTWSSML